MGRTPKGSPSLRSFGAGRMTPLKGREHQGHRLDHITVMTAPSTRVASSHDYQLESLDGPWRTGAGGAPERKAFG